MCDVTIEMMLAHAQSLDELQMRKSDKTADINVSVGLCITGVGLYCIKGGPFTLQSCRLYFSFAEPDEKGLRYRVVIMGDVM